MGTFGIGQNRAQWLSTGALAAMTIAMLLHAWMIRSFGQRKTFIGALGVFMAALVLAGFSPNESVLIFSRIVQGAVADLLQPLSMYTLFRVFPPEHRGSAMEFFGISVILGPALGPTLGGILIEHFNWRYIFYVAVPFSAAGMLLGSMFMPEREESDVRARFDWAGFLLLSMSLACLPFQRAARRLVFRLYPHPPRARWRRRSGILLMGTARVPAAGRSQGARKRSLHCGRCGGLYLRRRAVRFHLPGPAFRADCPALHPHGGGLAADA
jgi:MFS family permease